MSRNLIAATDFSAPARHALERAALLARDTPGAKLTLAHAVGGSLLNNLRSLLQGDAESLEAQVLAQAQKTLDELAARLKSRFGGDADTALLRGPVLDTLLELAEARDAHLLVMGVRGSHFVRELLIGSTTERVLRRLRRPLLAVKQRAESPYRRILAPVDFSAHAAAAVDAAHSWFPDAEIALLHAFEAELESTLRLAGVDPDRINHYRIQARDAAHEEMQAFAAKLQVPPEKLTRHFAHGPATLRILEYEISLDADLVVMGKRGQSMIEELLLGGVTKHVLAYCNSDVFVGGHFA